MSTLLRHDWPGNVRELEHVVERAAILATGPVLEVELIPVPRKPEELAEQHSEVLDEVNRRHILSILRSTNGVIGGPQGAAARLGMKRSTLNFRLKKLGIPRGHGRLQGSTGAEIDGTERRLRVWQ
jgi:formate hydrogenlyase transcriptional activator